MDDDNYKEIERRYQIAAARFDVADQLGWITAIFAGIAVELKWDSWLYSIIAFVLMFIAVTYRERKEYNIASKVYNQAESNDRDAYNDH